MTSGIMILFFGCFFLEQSTVLKKKLGAEIDIHQLSLLMMLATTIFAFIIVFLGEDWNFTRTLTSFFLLIFQVLAGVLFQELTNQAIHHADRSTFSVMSAIAIPLLLISDIVLGYGVSWRQIAGVILLTAMLGIAIFRGDFSMKGVKYVIASNLVSIGTIIAFKYSTSYYTSTEMMNLLNSGLMSFLFFVIVSRTKGRKGIKDALKPKYFGFASIYGMGGVLAAMAYKYMIASMVIALKRFFSMMFGVITGKLYFHEENVLRKLSIASLIGIGVFVMNIEPLVASYLGTSVNEEPIHAVAEILPPKEEKAEWMCSVPEKFICEL
jgi:drug/metabolite transporter (DMT)-like permease